MERQAAEEAAKAAKLASFKRRKSQKQLEKEAFDARVEAKRKSWTALDDHYAMASERPAGGPAAATSIRTNSVRASSSARVLVA